MTRRFRKPKRKTNRLLMLLGVFFLLVVAAGFLLPALTRRRESSWLPGRSSAKTCRLRMYEAAGAIACYREQTGEWPPSLETLVPRYLRSVPRCPLDFVEGRASYLYQPPRGRDFPILSCERHWRYGYDLYIGTWDARPSLPEFSRKADRRVPEHQASVRRAREQFEGCKAVLISVADALRVYKEDKGCLPERLEALWPAYLTYLPHCPKDFVPDRMSYIYAETDNTQVPLVTCERHWDYGFDLLIDRQFRVVTRRKEMDRELGPLE